MKGQHDILFMYILLSKGRILDCDIIIIFPSSTTLKNMIVNNLNLIERLKIDRIKTIKTVNIILGDIKLSDLTTYTTGYDI